MTNNKINFPPGLAKYDFLNKLSDLPFVQSVYLFGSRARGDAHPKSDIDIAVNCPSASFEQWQKVLDVIEDADTLLGIDNIVRYDTLSDSLFKRKIDESKVVVYES